MGIKAAIYGAIVIAVLLAAKFAYNAIFDAGWNAAVVKQGELIQDAKAEAVEKARQEWENTATIAEKEIVVEERIVEVIREVEKEIPTVVERIVTVAPECSDLGDDFAGLLNRQVNSGAGGPNSGPDTTSVPD